MEIRSHPLSDEPHSESELRMAGDEDGFRLLCRPGTDERVLAYVVCRPKERYSRHIITEAGSRAMGQQQFEAKVKPRMQTLSVAPKWHKRVRTVYPDPDDVGAVLKMLGMELPGYSPKAAETLTVPSTATREG